MKDNFFSKIESYDGNDVDELVKQMKSGLDDDNDSSQKLLFNGEECYVFYTPIKYTKWLMVTVVPCHAINMLSYLNGITVTLIVVLAMLFVFLVFYYYMKNGIEPLRQLARSADDMAKGRFDTPMPEMEHNDEISQLRDSIEKMQFAVSNILDEAKRSTDK